MNVDLHARQFNAQMVTLAREARALTQTELASKISVSQAQLSKLEAGLSGVTEPMLNKLVQVLKYPKEFFYQTDPVFGPGLSEFFHRRRQDVGAKVLGRVHAQINIVRMHIARLMRAVDIPESKIPSLDLDDFTGRPEEVARAVRAMWQMPAGPVANMVQTLENAGGIVVRTRFGTPQIDALTRVVPGLPPLFFVNEGLPTDRERLSLAHELGHLVMHHEPRPDMEAEANRFAAEFLMPAADVRPHLSGHRIDLARLAVLKPHWRVSMSALLYRAGELQVVTERQGRFLWMQFAKQGFKRREPAELDLAPETPTTLSDIFAAHHEGFGFGPMEFGQLLAAMPEEVVSMYRINGSPAVGQRQLRLVKQLREG